MMPTTRTILLFATAALLLLLLTTSSAFAARLTYPGASPCNTTLQACIDGAQSGDLIMMAGNADEDLNITDKSIRIQPVAGLPVPVVIGGSTPRHIHVANTAGGPNMYVGLNQLILWNASVTVDFVAGTENFFECSNSAIFSAENSFVISTWKDSRILIHNNYIFTNGPFVYGIAFSSFAQQDTGVEIYSNEFTGAGYNNVIALSLGGNEVIGVRVYSNIFHDTGINSLYAYAAAILVGTTDSIESVVDIVNNTFDEVGLNYGVWMVSHGSSAPCQVSVLNNIFSNSAAAVHYPSLTDGLTIVDEHNDSYNNTGPSIYGGYPAVFPHTYNPDYVDAANNNYELSTYSSCIDAGMIFPGNGMDAYDKPRTMGTQPDLGAVEVANSYWYGNHMLFMDQFNDSTLNPAYLYKNNWYEDGINLVAVPTRSATFLANSVYPGCTQCTFEGTIRSAGTLDPDSPQKLFLYGWYADKSNAVELLIKPDSHKWILRQRVNGKIVRKVSLFQFFHTEMEHRVALNYDGTNFTVTVHGSVWITMPAAGTPFGSFGMKVKGTEAYLKDIYVYD